MAFKKRVETRRVELATFIDVVFLLLIFFLVTFAVSMPGPPSEDEGMRKKIFDLPEAKGSEADNIAVYLEDADRVRHITHPTTVQADDEQRITYVALSRARDRLFLCIPPEIDVDLDAIRSLNLQVVDLRAAG